MKRLSLVAIVMVLGAFPAVSAGQELEWVFAGGVYNPAGEDFEDTASGPGIDVALRRTLGERLRIGAGVQWNQNGVQFTQDDWSTWAFFLESQIALSHGSSRILPFIAGRGAWITQSISTLRGERSATGWGGGGLVGVTISITSLVSLEIAVPLYHLAFGDHELDGVSVADTDSSGRLFGLRAGLAFDF